MKNKIALILVMLSFLTFGGVTLAFPPTCDACIAWRMNVGGLSYCNAIRMCSGYYEFGECPDPCFD